MGKILSLKKLMEGANPYSALLEQTRGLVKKWEPTGLLAGLDSEPEIHGMAILLENQARELLKEVSQTGGASQEEWSGVALPLVRRIFGEIAAKEFVSIQPMNLPSGLVFYLDFKYGSGEQPGFAANTSIYGAGGGLTPATTTAASGGLYGGGKFGYSVNNVEASAVNISNSLASGIEAYTGSVDWQDVGFDPDLSASLSTLRKLIVTASVFTRPDYAGVRAFQIWTMASASVTINGPTGSAYPNYTTYDVTNKRVTFIITGSSAISTWAQGATCSIMYHQQPTATARGDFEDASSSTGSIDSGTGYAALDIPEIDIELRSEPIVAKTRKLKAVWTPELAQDLNAYHSIDAEAELTSILSEYVSMEIDLEILDMLILNAVTTEYWSALPGYEYNTSTQLFEDLGSHTGTKNEWFQTLGNKIQRISNRIHRLTLRGGANFLVVSPDVATIIESIPGYAADTDGNETSYAMGVQKVGLLNSRFTVYKNPYMTQNIVLVGFRGTNFLETGAVYAPYIPLIMTPLVYDPNNFTPRRGVMTRYAKKLVRPEFYGYVTVANTENV